MIGLHKVGSDQRWLRGVESRKKQIESLRGEKILVVPRGGFYIYHLLLPRVLDFLMLGVAARAFQYNPSRPPLSVFSYRIPSIWLVLGTSLRTLLTWRSWPTYPMWHLPKRLQQQVSLQLSLVLHCQYNRHSRSQACKHPAQHRPTLTNQVSYQISRQQTKQMLHGWNLHWKVFSAAAMWQKKW